jgi:hypothetical protein
MRPEPERESPAFMRGEEVNTGQLLDAPRDAGHIE